MTGLLHEAPLPTVETELVQRLRTGRDLIAHGWCQGSFVLVGMDYANPQYCALGAIGIRSLGFVDIGQKTIQRTCELALVRALRTFNDYGDAVSVAGWNDSAWRTQAEVLELYDRAIELELEVS